MTRIIKIKDQVENRFHLFKRLIVDSSKKVLLLLPIAILVLALNAFINDRLDSFLSKGIVLYGLPLLLSFSFIALCIGAYIGSYYLWNTNIYLRSDAIYVIRNVWNRLARTGYRVPYKYIQFIIEDQKSLSIYFTREGRSPYGVDIIIKNEVEKSNLKRFFNEAIDSEESVIIPSSKLIKPKHVRNRFKVIPKEESKLSLLAGS